MNTNLIHFKIGISQIDENNLKMEKVLGKCNSFVWFSRDLRNYNPTEVQPVVIQGLRKSLET